MIIEDKRYEIDEVFRMIGEEYLSLDTDKGKKNSDIVVDGFRVHPISLRYMTFYQKGTACAYCGKSERILSFVAIQIRSVDISTCLQMTAL